MQNRYWDTAVCYIMSSQRSCIMQWREREQPDHAQSFQLDSVDMKNWSLKSSLMRFGWVRVASPGEYVWFSFCILCIFIGYRIRMILIMHGLKFSPWYIWGFNCSGETVQTSTDYPVALSLGTKNGCANPSSAEPILSWWHFYSPQRSPQIDRKVKFYSFHSVN